MNIYEKLLKVQEKLKAPKLQYNDYGKYNYRNAEDILEAVKPLCVEVGALITMTDEITAINNRYYVRALARFIDIQETDGNIKFIDTTAYAREEDTKKGMDGSQITGSASSYARKYALNGLLCIDDTKDADTPPAKNNDKNSYKNIKDEDLPFGDLPPSEPQMTLEEALGIEVVMKDGVKKKMSELSEEQLKRTESCMAGKYKEAAQIILLYRQGQK